MKKLVIFLCFSISVAQNGFGTEASPQGFQFGDGFSIFVPRGPNRSNNNQQPRPGWGHSQDSAGNRGHNFGWTPFGGSHNTRNPNLGENQNFHNNREPHNFGGFQNNQNFNNQFGGNRNPNINSNFGQTNNVDGSQLGDRNQPQNDLIEVTPDPQGGRRPWNFQSDETCRTGDGGVGSCVNIRNCGVYLNLLRGVRTNPGAIDVLRRSQCGFEGSDPKVCCPNVEPTPTVPPQTRPPQTERPFTQATPPQTPAIEPQKPSTEVQKPPTESPNADISSDDLVDSLPEPPECGLSNHTATRVVGGQNATLGGFPWMALLGYHSQFSSGPRWQCGGSLVTRKHVLTAAHCINGRENSLYVVRLGELDLSTDADGAAPVDVPIKRMIKHENYSPKAFTDDIGLLVLERSVEYTGLIKPICLPKPQRLRALTFERYEPLIAGWGDVEYKGPSASRLQVLQLPVVSNEFCKNAYRKYKAQVIDERVLCAGFESGGKDACQGDSGGPLMQPDYIRAFRKSYFYQIGVVSFGRKCAEAGYPGVYTRTTRFMPWLSKHIVGNEVLD